MTQNQYKLLVALEELNDNDWVIEESEEDFVKRFKERHKSAPKDKIEESQQRIVENIVKNEKK